MKSQNKFSILSFLPYFKGSWFIYSKMFKLLPYKYRFHTLESNIILDITDPPQFTAIKCRKGTIEPALTKFIKENLKTGDIFVDIGANWGYFSCIAADLVGGNGLVLSVEPLQKTFLNLLNTIQRNKLFNVIPFNVALSERSGEMINFEKPWYRQSTSAYMKKSKNGGATRVLNCDWIIKNTNTENRKIRMIKIDTEGAELLVLKGAIEALQKHNPFIIVETDDHYKRFGYTYTDLCEFLNKLNYQPVYILSDCGEGQIKQYDKTLVGNGVVFEKKV